MPYYPRVDAPTHPHLVSALARRGLEWGKNNRMILSQGLYTRGRDKYNEEGVWPIGAKRPDPAKPFVARFAKSSVTQPD